MEELKNFTRKQLRATNMSTLAEKNNMVIGNEGNGNHISDVVILEHLQEISYLNKL